MRSVFTRLSAGLFLIGLALSAPLAAQGLPGQYQVTGVAANDVLNIRAEPAAGAELLGSYGPYALNIEVLSLSEDGAWGRVGLPEGNGWVAMRYLVAQPLPAEGLPRPMTCFGTEPFWSLGLTARGEEFSTPDGPEDLSVISETSAEGGYMVTLSGESEWTGLIARGWCSDGMSDRDYGWQAMLFRSGADGNSLLSGCCTLDGN